jgi:hypothetical protein
MKISNSESEVGLSDGGDGGAATLVTLTEEADILKQITYERPIEIN